MTELFEYKFVEFNFLHVYDLQNSDQYSRSPRKGNIVYLIWVADQLIFEDTPTSRDEVGVFFCARRMNFDQSEIVPIPTKQSWICVRFYIFGILEV